MLRQRVGLRLASRRKLTQTLMNLRVIYWPVRHYAKRFSVIGLSGTGSLRFPFGYPPVLVSNVLSEKEKQQVIALGWLGWSLRQIERETGIRRETIAAYPEQAGVERRRRADGGSHQNRPVCRLR